MFLSRLIVPIRGGVSLPRFLEYIVLVRCTVLGVGANAQQSNQSISYTHTCSAQRHELPMLARFVATIFILFLK